MKNTRIKELIKNFAKQLAALFNEYSLYPPHHPNVIAQLKQTHTCLEGTLKEIASFYLDVLDDQFGFEEIPFYEIRHFTEKAAQTIGARGISAICFRREVSIQELITLPRIILDRSKTLNFSETENELKKSGVINISLQSRTDETAEEQRKIMQSDKVYGGSIEANKLIFNAIQSNNVLPVDIVDKIARDIVDMILKDTSSIIALASLRDYDEYTFTHSSNVAILSVAVAKNIVKDSSLLKHLAKAALLHDIGKTLIPTHILNKPGKLTEDEWAIMKQHSILGANILEKQEQISKLTVIIAAQHHMKYDLSGYPHIEGVTRLHPLSCIVSICDTYDAITSKRVYKKPISADRALAIMMGLIGCDFDPYIFKIFTHIMGVYPVGSFVRLNTKEVAIVKKIHPHALLLPEVQIITGETGKINEEPLTLDLSKNEENPSGRVIDQIIDPVDCGIDPLRFI